MVTPRWMFLLACASTYNLFRSWGTLRKIHTTMGMEEWIQPGGAASDAPLHVALADTILRGLSAGSSAAADIPFLWASSTPTPETLVAPTLSLSLPTNKTTPIPPAERATAAASPKNNHIRKDSTSNNNKPVPVVVISALRPDYLDAVLKAIQPSHQNPHTPAWILHSKRYVFCHKNNFTDRDNRWNETQTVAQKYNFDVHVFDGLPVGLHPPRNPIRAYYTKIQWYHMMDYLFHTLNETEVLLLEDDAVLAHDGLLVAASLLRTQHTTRPDVHHVALGGAAGINKINADPNAIMVVRPHFFTAMAYSLNVTVFDQIHATFQHLQASLAGRTQDDLDRQENYIGHADWTMEIIERHFVKDLLQLEPSVGRMHHIGLVGMGYDGNGRPHQPFPVPWRFCQTIVANDTRTMDDLVLLDGIRDMHGFDCPNTMSAVHRICPGTPPLTDRYGANQVTMRKPEAAQPKEKIQLTPEETEQIVRIQAWRAQKRAAEREERDKRRATAANSKRTRKARDDTKSKVSAKLLAAKETRHAQVLAANNNNVDTAEVWKALPVAGTIRAKARQATEEAQRNNGDEAMSQRQLRNLAKLAQDEARQANRAAEKAKASPMIAKVKPSRRHSARLPPTLAASGTTLQKYQARLYG